MLINDATDHLMASLSTFGRTGHQLALKLADLVVVREGKKGLVLVRRGKRQQMVWFVHQGTAKEVSVDEPTGRTWVSWFWYRSNFIFSHPGFFAAEPAAASIELLEDCILLGIAHDDLVKLRESFPEMSILVEKIRAHTDRMRAEHASDLVNLNARERYQKFFSLHKPLFNVAKHMDIASFLAIKDDGFHRYR